MKLKCFGIVIMIAVGLVLGACGGGSSNSGNINGNWTATLTNTDNSPAFGFTTSLTQSSGTDVTVANFNFTTSSPCFASGDTETGSFTLSGNFNGNVTGGFGMTIQSGTPSGNTLTLQGTVKNNAVTGTWTLTGVTSGCTGAGTFTMTHS
jgi:hypothetical protein